MTRITMSLSSAGDWMVKLWFAFSNNTFACNTTFMLASSFEDIKEGIRVKLEYSIFDTLASEDRMAVSVFIFAKHLVTFYLKNSKIKSNEHSLFSLFCRIRTWKLLTTFDLRLAICIFADALWPSCSSHFKENFP